MSRIKIKPQGKKVFQHHDSLRITDMNYGDHLGNDKVLSLFHDARVRWMHENQQTELDFYHSSLIQHDSIVNYKAQALAHDEIIIEVFIDDIDFKSFDFYYRISRCSDQEEIAVGKTGMTFFNYQTNKIAKTPEEFIKLFGQRYGIN